MEKNNISFTIIGLFIVILRCASVMWFGYLISETSTSPKFLISAMALAVIPAFALYYQRLSAQGLREQILMAYKHRVQPPEFILRGGMVLVVAANSIVTLAEVPAFSLGFTLGIIFQRAQPIADSLPTLGLAFASVLIGSLFGAIAGQVISKK